MSNIPRIDRVAPLIEGKLGEILLRRLPQHALQVSITRVIVSRDLRSAKIWLDIEAENPDKILQKIQKLKGAIRHDLSQSIAIQSCPDLNFVRDENPDYVKRIDELIEEIHKQKKE